MVIKLLGLLLRRIRAGEQKLAWNHPSVSEAPDTVTLTSKAFSPNGKIPIRFAGNGIGENISPSLEWNCTSKCAVEMILVIEDPDAPTRAPIVHLLATNIASTRSGVGEGELTDGSRSEIVFGCASFGRHGYAGPRALQGHGIHHYVFQIFVLDRRFPFDRNASLKSVMGTIGGHVIERGKLVGTFAR